MLSSRILRRSGNECELWYSGRPGALAGSARARVHSQASLKIFRITLCTSRHETRATIEVHHLFSDVARFWSLIPLPKTDFGET